jgi:hypothetical protein
VAHRGTSRFEQLTDLAFVNMKDKQLSEFIKLNVIKFGTA